MRKLMSLALVSTAALGLAACDVEQTEEGEMPEVDVNGGELPEYNVDAADVDVEMEEQTVEVPTLEVEEADASQ
ncbi:MAG: hypothetical protein B7Y87_00920 [Sphingomonadales bacterium 32-64-22]|nr:MAG: hypothetical protein B7Y87_00920 [Sphingomonadales bacterium 32-64-22]